MIPAGASCAAGTRLLPTTCFRPRPKDRRSNGCFPPTEEAVQPYRGEERVQIRSEPGEPGATPSLKPLDDRLDEAERVDLAICAALGARRGIPDPRLTAWVRDEARTRLPAQALVELVLRFGMDRIEFDALVEHLPLRRPAARRDRRCLAWLGDGQVRIARTVGASVIKAMISISPPQRGHTRGNSS